MEEKESMVFGSAGGNSQSDSPAPVSIAGGGTLPPHQAMNNMPVNLDSNRESMVAGGSGGPVAGKKKRGRPRKYDADGNLTASFFTSPKSAPPPPPPGFSGFSHKRGRGRPPGSGNWQLLAASLGELFAYTAGGDFRPHVVIVNAGEDVAGKILSLSQQGPRGICVLSANGAISNVTIHQHGSCGGLLTYEGRFEILSLTGSFTMSENDVVRCKTGGLSVSLAGPDGRVIGGAIAGSLVAASPIQMVIGSFISKGSQTHKRKQQYVTTTPGVSENVIVATPISQAAPGANIHFTPTSKLPAQNNGADADNSTPDEQNQISSPSSEKHNVLEPVSAEKHYPDMSKSLRLE